MFIPMKIVSRMRCSPLDVSTVAPTSGTDSGSRGPAPGELLDGISVSLGMTQKFIGNSLVFLSNGFVLVLFLE